MDFSFNYFHFHELKEMEKTNFIRYILKKCEYDIKTCESGIIDSLQEDFKQDIKLKIIQKICKNDFTYLFYNTYFEYQKNILSDSIIQTGFFRDYFKKIYGNHLSNEQKVEKILSYEFYKEFKEYFFQIKFIAYIKKIIRNEYLIYVKAIDRMKSQMFRLKNYYLTPYFINDDHLELLACLAYLNDDDKRLIKLCVLKTQAELAKDYHMTQQNLSYKLKKIKEKL